jgi:hypothetical protein
VTEESGVSDLRPSSKRVGKCSPTLPSHERVHLSISTKLINEYCLLLNQPEVGDVRLWLP